MAIHNLNYNTDTAIDRFLVGENDGKTNAIVRTFTDESGKNRDGVDLVTSYVIHEIIIKPGNNIAVKWRKSNRTKGGYLISAEQENGITSISPAIKVEVLDLLNSSGILDKIILSALDLKFRTQIEQLDFKPIWGSDNSFQSQIVFNYTATGLLDASVNDGSITITDVEIGEAPYKYRLSDASDNSVLINWTDLDLTSSPTISNLSVGEYRLAVKDANNVVSKQVLIPIIVAIE